MFLKRLFKKECYFLVTEDKFFSKKPCVYFLKLVYVKESMFLTKEEEAILAGEQGTGYKEAMEILVSIGDIYNAEKLIPVQSAQIAGVSYKTARDAVIVYLKHLIKENAKVKIPAYLNPAGMDINNWKEMGIPENFAQKQQEIIELYSQLGIFVSCSCTPYFIGNIAQTGEHLAWSESSAVVFANSYFGARTNREGGPTALAAALIGKTPYFGLHLTENRVPTVKVNVELDKTMTSADYSALGLWAGKQLKMNVPLFTNLPITSSLDYRAMSAGLGASGAVPLFHVKDLSPEKDLHNDNTIIETITFTQKELKSVYESYTSDTVDMVCIGCPHAHLTEIAHIAKKMKGKKTSIPFWIFTARGIFNQAQDMGYIKTLSQAGVSVISDTCPVVAPFEGMFSGIATNSAKAAYYLPSMTKVESTLTDLDHLIEISLRGHK